MSVIDAAEVNAAYLAGEHVPAMAKRLGLTSEQVMELVAQHREDRACDGVLPGMGATRCDECRRTISPEVEPHHDHDEDCDLLAGATSCRCDNTVHPDCCRTCHPALLDPT